MKRSKSTEDNVATRTPLSYRLRRLREAQNLTQERLAELSGLTGKAIYNYEKGKSVPRKDNLIAISNALQIPLAKVCPFYSFVNIRELLGQRLDEEIGSLKAFIHKASPLDLERLERLLDVYLMSSGMQKLEIDFIIHRAVTSYSNPNSKSKINTLTLQFFSQIDEFVADSGLLDSVNDDIMTDIHVSMVKAALEKDLAALKLVYDRHLEVSEQFVRSIFETVDRLVINVA